MHRARFPEAEIYRSQVSCDLEGEEAEIGAWYDDCKAFSWEQLVQKPGNGWQEPDDRQSSLQVRASFESLTKTS